MLFAIYFYAVLCVCILWRLLKEKKEDVDDDMACKDDLMMMLLPAVMWYIFMSLKERYENLL